jgi:undecaprenyl-diphosphatase
MPRSFLILFGGLLLLLLPASPLTAQTPPADPTPSESPEAPRPTFTDAIVLGLVEGITEFLPISSTGHLIVANRLLGLDSPAVVHTDAEGATTTFKEAADTFLVVIQIGAIAAVALLYWRQIAGVLAGLAGRDPAGLRLLRNLILACLPPGLLGLALGGLIKERLFSVETVAWALLVGAALMWFAERWRRRRDATATATPETASPGPADLSPARALVVGLVQCLALWPGMSRSMSAMVGGYFVGLRPVRAAEFSFLLGLPLLGAAAAKDALDGGAAMISAFGWPQVLVGLLVSFLSAAVAVRVFVGFLTRHGLAPFALYRVLLAGGLLYFFSR